MYGLPEEKDDVCSQRVKERQGAAVWPDSHSVKDPYDTSLFSHSKNTSMYKTDLTVRVVWQAGVNFQLSILLANNLTGQIYFITAIFFI